MFVVIVRRFEIHVSWCALGDTKPRDVQRARLQRARISGGGECKPKGLGLHYPSSGRRWLGLSQVKV